MNLAKHTLTLNSRLRRLTFALWIAGLALALIGPVMAQGSAPHVIVLEADGPIIPPMRAYIQRGIREAEESGADAVVIELNTPGGDLLVTQGIVQDIRSSSVPVIVYVAPRGAIAASAGTLVTLAGHASAMAPESAIGAASPVGPQGEDLPETMAAKEEEILSAQARSLAERRGDDAVELAEQAIVEAKAVSASEALDANFVDFVAADLDDLLEQADGLEVTLQGDTAALQTAGGVLAPFGMSVLERLLFVIVNPTIVFVLLSIGTVAIIIEIASPGGWAAGTVGVACLGLAFYGLGVLPVNWLGGVFILMAFILFVLDVKATTGGLTAAAVGSLIAGAILLLNTPATMPFGRLSIPVVVFVSLLIAALFFFGLSKVVATQGRQFMTGPEAMIGLQGLVLRPLDPEGTVLVASERWRARAADGAQSIPKDARVEVVSIEGWLLTVRLLESPDVSEEQTASD